MKKVYECWQKVGMKYFWGDLFDSRFYIAYLISRRKIDIILDIGCGAAVLLHFANAPLKIGIDYSPASLKKAKELDPKIELIRGDARCLPLRNNTFGTILSIFSFTEFQSKEDWLRMSTEVKRVSKTNCEIIIAGANRTSKHFQKTHDMQSRQDYLHYQDLMKLFKDFDVKVEGYSPHSKVLMYPLKILFKVPDKILEILMIENLLYCLLRSKRYLKDGRSYVMTCKRQID